MGGSVAQELWTLQVVKAPKPEEAFTDMKTATDEELLDELEGAAHCRCHLLYALRAERARLIHDGILANKWELVESLFRDERR